MDNKLNDPLWIEILKIAQYELDAYVNSAIIKLLKLTDLSEEEIENEFGVLNCYCNTRENRRKQKNALYKMLAKVRELQGGLDFSYDG